MIKEDNNQQDPEMITRREAFKKAGRYIAYTGIASMIILTPKRAQAESPPPDPGWGEFKIKGKKSNPGDYPPDRA